LVREVNELKSKVLSMEKYMNELDIRIIRLNATIDMFSKKGELTENKMQNEQYHTNSFY
jgi:predicted  nucleic acid-binding Zn-ribbon protein